MARKGLRLPGALALMGAAALIAGTVPQAVLAQDGAFKIGLMLPDQLTPRYEQFDKPIGAFQAIAHYLADRQTELDGARTLVHEAAWARATGRSVARLAPMAKLFACRTARQVTATAQQVHGGNGFTVEYDVQLYFRRVKALQLSWWGDRDLEELIAADVLDVPTSGP